MDLFFGLLFLLTIPGTAELLLLTFGALLSRSKGEVPRHSPFTGSLAIVIPAHNESSGISACLEQIKRCEDPADNSEIVVIADNCEDDTALIAEEHQVRVLIRDDKNNRGKGYALQYGCQQLLQEGFEAFLIIDADTQADNHLISEVRNGLAHDTQVVQVRYGVLNSVATLRTRLLSIALDAFNYLRPLGRNWWGFSAGIAGNGFALRGKVLKAVPFVGGTIAEDLDYHLRLVQNGYHVRFISQTAVWGMMPESEEGASTQRARWEGGRLRLMLDRIPEMVVALVRGNILALEPLLDLILLPLAYHVVLLGLCLFSSISWVAGYGVIGLVLVGLHVMVALYLGGNVIKRGAALIYAPIYLLWKIMMLSKILFTSKKDATWVRTERSDQ